MGLENHRYRHGRLINVLVRFVINVLVWKFYKERIVFAAARYNPTYKNKPDDALHCRVFVFWDII
jgi:hypothetical protein